MKQVRIGPLIFQIVIKPDEEMKDENGGGLHGQARGDLTEIWLNAQHTHESRFLILWHEVIHSIADVYGARISENTVTALASGIAQVLQDNPNLNWTNYNAALRDEQRREIQRYLVDSPEE